MRPNPQIPADSKKSGKCQGVGNVVLVKHVIAYLFLVNSFFGFRVLIFQENF